MSWLESLSLGWRRRLPTVLQTEAAECGLACLCMVLGYHGTLTDLPTLRRRYAMSMTGMTLATLSRIGQQENLGGRAVRLELDELHQLRLPAILHWDMNHYVVLKSVSSRGCVIVDPGSGQRTMGFQEMSRHFTGVALELWPDTGFKPRREKTRISLAQLTGHIAGLWPSLAQVLMMSVALQVFALVSPLFLQWIVDQVVVSRDRDLLTTLAVGFLLVMLLQVGIGVLRSMLLLGINTSIRVQWRSNVFTHLMRLPLGWFQRRHLGDIVSRTGAADEIQRVLTSAFVEGILDGVLVLATLALMFVYSPKLAAVAVAGVALYLLLRLVWFRALYTATEEQIVRAAQLSTHYLESIRGMRAIKLFARQGERRGAWQTLLVGETNSTLAIAKLRIVYSLARSILSGVFNIALLWLGAAQIMDGQFSIGMLMAFLSYRGQFESRVTALIDQVIDLKMLQLHGERLADVVLAEPEPVGRQELVPRPRDEPPQIRIENVRFRYSEHEPWVLDGLQMTIRPGEAVGIAGPSGCGKTTLVQLLLGVLQPVEGAILIDDVALDAGGVEAWRAQVGTVMQDDTLFAGSIAENIAFFDPSADAAWIESCARMAAIHEDIMRMPMGYQTLVGDMGAILSGGQKQRVLLARALYKRPTVLLLDEATSHLDMVREAQVSDAIAQLRVTRIIVAHNPETLCTAQRVVQIAGGKVAYEGPPAAYLARMHPRLVDA